jgi:spoIIIJ-associated protein
VETTAEKTEEDKKPVSPPPYDDDDDDFFNEDGTYREDVEEVKPPKPARRPPKQDYRPPHKREQSSRRRGKQDKQQVSEVATPPVAFPETATDAELAEQLLTEMLEIMRIDADIELSRADPSDRDNEDGPPWMMNIVGNDKRMGDLIGKRGETLSALQYLTRLMVSKQTEARANVIVDVDNYRRSRSEKLEKLANRMADQAVETGRMVKMEPMPPHERRIIHMVLRKRDDVDTESQGQGNTRRVTILPK